MRYTHCLMRYFFQVKEKDTSFFFSILDTSGSNFKNGKLGVRLIHYFGPDEDDKKVYHLNQLGQKTVDSSEWWLHFESTSKNTITLLSDDYSPIAGDGTSAGDLFCGNSLVEGFEECDAGSSGGELKQSCKMDDGKWGNQFASCKSTCKWKTNQYTGEVETTPCKELTEADIANMCPITNFNPTKKCVDIKSQYYDGGTFTGPDTSL